MSTSAVMHENHYIFTNWTRFLFFFKIFTLGKVLSRLESAFILRDSLKHWIKLSKLFMLIIFTAHFCACLFFGLGKAEVNYLG